MTADKLHARFHLQCRTFSFAATCPAICVEICAESADRLSRSVAIDVGYRVKATGNGTAGTLYARVWSGKTTPVRDTVLFRAQRTRTEFARSGLSVALAVKRALLEIDSFNRCLITQLHIVRKYEKLSFALMFKVLTVTFDFLWDFFFMFLSPGNYRLVRL